MALRKQRKDESDADFAVRLEAAKEAAREAGRKYREANKEAERKRERGLPKQRKNESDADFAVRLKTAKKNRQERQRKWREANREAANERHREWYKANREAELERARKYREANREAVNERKRKWREANTLTHAKGRPLRRDFSKTQRPKMLTKLILQEAEWVCEYWGISQDQKWDTPVLRQAAVHIRDFPFYPLRHFEPGESIAYAEANGLTRPTNPWYHTDYLHDSTINDVNWACRIRTRWRNKV